jgi:hypothetical protein
MSKKHVSYMNNNSALDQTFTITNMNGKNLVKDFGITKMNIQKNLSTGRDINRAKLR